MFKSPSTRPYICNGYVIKNSQITKSNLQIGTYSDVYLNRGSLNPNDGSLLMRVALIHRDDCVKEAGEPKGHLSPPLP